MAKAFSDLNFMDKLMPAKAESKWDNLWDFLDGLAETAQVSENGYKEPGDAEALLRLPLYHPNSPSQTARYTPLRGSCCRYRAPTPFWGTQVLQALIFLWQNI